MKIAAYHLEIELTKRCNLNCNHRSRGKMHNVNISREILEKVFDNEILGDCNGYSGLAADYICVALYFYLINHPDAIII